jgi:pimeloyl-ACP methyl ester carboxylesterase
VRVPSADGVEIEVHDLGGDGEPLLICHATGFCGMAYEPLAAALRPHHRVWAVDFRAHGDSTAPDDGDLSWAGAASDVLAAVDAIGESSVHVVGHSMGGSAALLAELRRPGVLRSAYLFEPIILPGDSVNPGGPNDLAGSARKRREVFPSRAEALRRYASRPPLDVFRADTLYAYVEHGFEDLPDGTVRLKCRAEDEARTFEAEGKATVERIRGLTVPATIAIGSTDRGWTPAMFGPAIVEALANARLVAYRHLGHFGPLQDPDSVAEDILVGHRSAR